MTTAPRRPTVGVLLLLALALGGGAAAATPAGPERRADGTVLLGVADPGGATVRLTFGPDRAAAEALLIETRRAGAPGSLLEVAVDGGRGGPLYSAVLTPDQCRFDDAGSACRIAVAGGTPAYAAFVQAFRKGRSLRVRVQNEGNMLMDRDASLAGFTRAYGAARPARRPR